MLFGACFCALAGTEACGSFGEETSGVGIDGAGSDAAAADGPGAGQEGSADATNERPPFVVGPRCKVGSAFGAPHLATVLGGYSVEAARLAPDRLSGWFSLFPLTGGKAEADLYSGGRTVPDTFDGFARLSASQNGKYDSYPTITPDGLYLLFTSDRTSPGVKIFSAKVQGSGFEPAQALALPAKPSAMVYGNEPYLLGDGMTMYFSAANSSASDYDLFRAKGPAPSFGSANGVLLSNNTSSEDVAPVVAEDELEMFWASNRGDALNKGDLDIWTATRPTSNPSYRFEVEKIVAGLSTQGKDYPTWLSPDACHLYLIQKNASAIGTLMVADR